MIDTIKLTLEDGAFEIIDTMKFKPDAELVLRAYTKFPLLKAIQNTTREESKDKIYKPKLTLSRSFGILRLVMEFSIPKLIFGNNFEEVSGLDYLFVIKKLQKALLEMGVEVEEQYLKEARVNMVHYGKNFILTDIINSITLINLVGKADTSFRTDISTKYYKNGGQLVSFYTKVQEIVFYDKMKDLQRSLNISKSRSEEVDAELQRQFLAEYGKHEILRMEVRIAQPKKLEKVITKEMGADISTTTARAMEEEGGGLRFCHVFNDDIAKKILSNYLKQIKTMLYTVIASHKDNLLQFLIFQGFKHKDAFAYSKAREVMKEYGERSFRNMFPTIYKAMTKAIDKKGIALEIEMESHNHAFLSQAFNKLEDILYNFKPIRLENGKHIQGYASLTDTETESRNCEFLPKREAKYYKDMTIKITPPKDKTEQEEILEALEDDEDTTV